MNRNRLICSKPDDCPVKPSLPNYKLSNELSYLFLASRKSLFHTLEVLIVITEQQRSSKKNWEKKRKEKNFLCVSPHMLRLTKVPYFKTILHRAKDMLKQTYTSFLVLFLINLEFISLWLQVLIVYVGQTEQTEFR